MPKKDEKSKRNDRKNEKLSQREWRELMGMNKPTYQRHRGAYRQK